MKYLRAQVSFRCLTGQVVSVYLLQQRQVRLLSQLPLQQRVGVSGVRRQVGGVTRQQIRQADPRGAVS